MLGQSVSPRAMRTDWFLLVLLALSLATNVILGLGLVHSARATLSPSVRGPAIGTVLPAMVADRLNGTRERIPFEAEHGADTLVYVFSPSCKWCETNASPIRFVAAQSRSRGLRVIGVSMVADGTEAFTRAQRFDFPVYINPTDETIRAYGLGSTPQTLLISSNGRLKKSWTGAYVGATRSAIESWLGLRLPDAPPVSGPALEFPSSKTR